MNNRREIINSNPVPGKQGVLTTLFMKRKVYDVHIDHSHFWINEHQPLIQRVKNLFRPNPLVVNKTRYDSIAVCGRRSNGTVVALLVKKGRKYIFIGETIFSFRPIDEITDFIVPTNKNGMTYPQAVGTMNTYLLAGDCYVPNDIVKLNPYTQVFNNPYIGKRIKVKDIHSGVWE